LFNMIISSKAQWWKVDTLGAVAAQPCLTQDCQVTNLGLRFCF